MSYDLEKAYGRNLKDILKQTLMKTNLPKVYVNIVKNMHECANTSTSVQSVCEETKGFNVEVEVPTPEFNFESQLVFLNMNKVTKYMWGKGHYGPWCMLF